VPRFSNLAVAFGSLLSEPLFFEDPERAEDEFQEKNRKQKVQGSAPSGCQK